MKNPIKTLDRTIAARMRSFDVVSAAIRAPGTAAGDILNARYAPATPDGPPAADYHKVLADLGGDLTAAHQVMLAVNTGHQGQLARVVELAGRRDDFASGLFGHFIKVRHSLENLYGGIRGFTVVGVAGSTLRDPSGLVKQVRETVDFLGSPKVTLPVVDGFNVDHTRVAVRLATDADALDEVLAEVAEARKDAEATRLQKNDAIKAYDRTFLYVARTIEGLFNIAGLHDAADRVRPSSRRPGTRAADEAEPADQEEVSETPSSDQASGEASSSESP